jgi:hypothetical protein
MTMQPKTWLDERMGEFDDKFRCLLNIKHSHYANLTLRIDGKNVVLEADSLKELRPFLRSALEDCVRELVGSVPGFSMRCSQEACKQPDGKIDPMKGTCLLCHNFQFKTSLIAKAKEMGLMK